MDSLRLLYRLMLGVCVMGGLRPALGLRCPGRNQSTFENFLTTWVNTAAPVEILSLYNSWALYKFEHNVRRVERSAYLCLHLKIAKCRSNSAGLAAFLENIDWR